MERVKTLIIGAGINGVITAYHLARQGQEVTVLERASVACEGSSANAGTLSVQNKPIRMTRSTIAAVEEWKALNEALDGQLNYHRIGGFRIAQTEEQLKKIRDIAALQREQGLLVEPCSAEDILRAEPNITENILGGNYCEIDGYADSKTAVRNIARAAEKLGADFRTYTPALSVREEGDGYIIQTPKGEIFAYQVVLSTGMWAKPLLEPLGVVLPIEQRLFQMIVTEPAPDLINRVITHATGKLTIKQSSENGSLLIGGGWRGIGDYRTFQKDVSLDNMVGNAQLAISCFPKLAGLQVLRTWAGFDARTPDEVPIFGEVPGHKGLFVIGAGQGGFTTGPAYGRFMAELLMTGKTSDIVAEFSLARFMK